MIDFAKYAFPKAHSAAYAVVAYRTAYFKILLSSGIYGSSYFFCYGEY